MASFVKGLYVVLIFVGLKNLQKVAQKLSRYRGVQPNYYLNVVSNEVASCTLVESECDSPCKRFPFMG